MNSTLDALNLSDDRVRRLIQYAIDNDARAAKISGAGAGGAVLIVYKNSAQWRDNIDRIYAYCRSLSPDTRLICGQLRQGTWNKCIEPSADGAIDYL